MSRNGRQFELATLDDRLPLGAKGDDVRREGGDDHRSSVRVLSMLRETLQAVEALDERKLGVTCKPVTLGGNNEPLVQALDRNG